MIESFRHNAYASRRFQNIVQVARTTNPFYRRWISDAEQVPILGRATFLENNEEILNGNPVTGRTSGSTGIPVRFCQGREWVRAATADTMRFVKQLGGPLPVLRIVYTPGGEKSGVLNVTSSVNDQIRHILEHRRIDGLKAITTYPTNSEWLARAVVERGIDMSFIERFGLFGECVEEYQKDLIRTAFPNARIWTTYSAMEFGLIATMCPYEPDYHHLNAHRLGVEILRDDGRPAADGERGRVVITDYINRWSPFIRYEIGDFAVRGICPCGRIRLPALRHVYGKVRGALLHKNGDRILFADLSVALRDIPGMKQYQVIQESLEEFHVTVVAKRNLDNEIRTAFQNHFGYLPNDLRIRYVNSIPLGPNGKFHAAICNV